jgi:DNA-binding CsgD family transcriptional regulator
VVLAGEGAGDRQGISVSLISGENSCQGGRPGEYRLESKDVAGLLHLMAELGGVRNDPRRWRIEALTGVTRMLPAAAGAAMIVRLNRDDPEGVPTVVSVFDYGFKVAGEREAFLTEFNEAPFRDPLSKRLLHKVIESDRRTITCLRREMVEDAEWYTSANVEGSRRSSRVDDCVMSVHRFVGGGEATAGTEGPLFTVLMAFRNWGDPARFTPRERQVLDSLHEGLEWFYRSEETLQRVTRATALSPRLRQTLDFLLSGDTERQVAARMSISIHTVHDYVKALYVHFGVSSRGELTARWIQSGQTLPAGGQEG